MAIVRASLVIRLMPFRELDQRLAAVRDGVPVDGETAYKGGNLTGSFTAGSTGAEDVLGIRNQGTGAGQIGVSGAKDTSDFALSGGGVLRAHGDGSGYEFWTFHHRALPVVYVGT